MGKPRIADLAPASTELLAIPVASITGTVITIEIPHSEPAFRFEVTENHTEAGFTLVRNGVSKPLTMPNGDAVTELTTETMFYDVVEKASAFCLAPKGAKLIGDAQPTDVLVGKTFMNADGEQIGLGDVNLISSNIKNGKTIFNVAGSIIPITVNASTNYVAITSSTFYISWPNTYNIRHGYTIPVDGSARMSVDLYGDNGSVAVQFLLNGVSFATRQTSIIGNWTTFTIDKPISSGDELQIILYTTASSVTGQARNFKIGYSAATPPNPISVSY